jgi:hypothetical protein
VRDKAIMIIMETKCTWGIVGGGGKNTGVKRMEVYHICTDEDSIIKSTFFERRGRRGRMVIQWRG